jgi:hypothetical protein
MTPQDSLDDVKSRLPEHLHDYLSEVPLVS